MLAPARSLNLNSNIFLLLSLLEEADMRVSTDNIFLHQALNCYPKG